MARKKHRKQAEVRTLPNVFHPDQADAAELILQRFGTDKKFIVEIGCGNGEYTIALAKQSPDNVCIGIDRAGGRIWNAATKALKEKALNAGFLLSFVERLPLFLPGKCVETLWIPFPNPLPRRRSMKAMLVHPRFLAIYKLFLLPGARVNLKTDDDILYEYMLGIVNEHGLTLHEQSADIHADGKFAPDVMLPTRFEKFQIAQGKTIKYVSFSLPEDSFQSVRLPDFEKYRTTVAAIHAAED